MNPDNARLDELLGAYALNAVDDKEKREIEAYLEVSPRAAAEVADHLSVAAALAGSTSEVPAPSWDSINSAISATRQQIVAPISLDAQRARSSKRTTQLTGRSNRSALFARVATIAASLAIVGFGLQMFTQESRMRDLRNEMAADQQTLSEAQREVKRLSSQDQFNVETVLATPGARVAALNDDENHSVGRVLLDGKGRGFLVLSDGQPLKPGQAYQLWGVHDQLVISLGVMQPGNAAMPLSAAGDWSQFVLTVETLPGVVASKGPAVAAGTFVS